MSSRKVASVAVVATLLFLFVTAFGHSGTAYTFGDFLSPDTQVVSDVLTIDLVGDVFLGRAVERRMDAYGQRYPFLRLTDEWPRSDFVVVNFEAAVPAVHTPTPDFGFQFSVASSALATLREVGVTHASLANNHSFDFGETGFEETNTALTAAGITPFGGEHTTSSAITWLEQDGGTVALVGLNIISTTHDTATLQDIVRYAAERSTFTIVYIHWGTEYVPVHNEAQRTLAEALIDAGANSIIGHHPHVVQDIGWYRGVPIFYSLGNFIFDQYFNRSVQEGLWLRLSLTDREVTYELVPVSSTVVRSQPQLIAPAEAEEFLAMLAEKSTSNIQTDIRAGLVRQAR